MLFQTIPIDVSDIVDANDVTGRDVVTALLIIAVSLLIAFAANRLIRKWLSSVEGLPEAARDSLSRFTGYLVVLVGVLIALPYLGFQSQPVLLILLVVAVLIFFASRPLLESFTAGLIIQARGPFGVGDLIQHGDYLGTVKETNGRTTIIVTPDGQTVAIPNISMLKAPITNLSDEGARRTTVNVGVAYGTDLDAALDVVTAAVTGLDLVLDDPQPTIGIISYEESAIRIQVWCWHLPSMMDEFLARDQVIRSIDRALRDAHIVIAFPQRDVWLRKPLDTHPDGVQE
ncbi:MAG: mechanosensitive ion channel family protein [Actinomycetia bacterium]|nr:mechanosensitive ion channel family protein [Actinomycetes bacterium]